MAVIVLLPTRARTGSALQKSKSDIVEAHRKKVKKIIISIHIQHYNAITLHESLTEENGPDQWPLELQLCSIFTHFFLPSGTPTENQWCKKVGGYDPPSSYGCAAHARQSWID